MMISANTVSDIAKVAFGSVVGTDFQCSTPKTCSMNHGMKSTGMRSSAFMQNTQTNTVIASGVTSALLPWKVSRTC